MCLYQALEQPRAQVKPLCAAHQARFAPGSSPGDGASFGAALLGAALLDQRLEDSVVQVTGLGKHVRHLDAAASVPGGKNGKTGGKQRFDIAVPRHARGPAKDNSNQATSVPNGGGRKGEARSARETRLDPVNAGHCAQKVVVIPQHLVAKGELLLLKILIVLRKMLNHRPRQNENVTCGGHLTSIWQAMGVNEMAVGHAQRLCTRRHQPAKFGHAAGDMLGKGNRHVIGGFGGKAAYGLIDRQAFPRPQSQLGWLLPRGILTENNPVVQLERSRRKALEHNVKRHHLRDGCRKALGIGMPRIKHFTSFGISKKGGIFRLLEQAGRLHRRHRQQPGCNKQGRRNAHAAEEMSEYLRHFLMLARMMHIGQGGTCGQRSIPALVLPGNEGYLAHMNAPGSAPRPAPVWRHESGPVPYPESLARMEAHVEAMAAGAAGEEIWLVEHPPVITAGTSAKPEDLVEPDRFPVLQAGRGGRYTYHGPGQRVVYPMLDLGRRGRDVRRHVEKLERWVILALGDLGIKAFTSDIGTGIWVEGADGLAKIGAIGVRVRRWISFHGLSINVSTDLGHFGAIIPCGISGHGVARIIDINPDATMADLDMALFNRWADAFDGGLRN